MIKSDYDLAKELWEEVQNETIIPLKDEAFFNEKESTFMLLEDLVMLTVYDGKYFLSFSLEISSAFAVTDVFDWVFTKTNQKPIVVDSYYVYVDEDEEPVFLMGEEAERFYLKDRCFSVFKDLLQTKNMSDFLEDLNVEDMVKC